MLLDVFKAIHDWEQGERQRGRTYHIEPEQVLTETALYHGKQSIIRLPPHGHVIKA